MNVCYKLQKITISLYKNRLVSSPKQLPVTLMRSIETLRIDAVYIAHAAGQIGIRRLNEEMIVVRHLTIDGNSRIPKLSCFHQECKECLVVLEFLFKRHVRYTSYPLILNRLLLV